VIGFGFASHWLKNWRDPFEPITKRSNRNHVITFDSQLKTALRSKTKTNRTLYERFSGAFVMRQICRLLLGILIGSSRWFVPVAIGRSNYFGTGFRII